MIATRKGRRFNSGKEINNGLNRNRENTGAGVSRFQILEQASDDREHPTHAAMNDIPSTSHQLNTANPYQIFSVNHEFNPSHQQISPLGTTLDPKKHTVILCDNQNFSFGNARATGSDHRDRLGRAYEHSSDPPDVQNSGCVNDVNAQAHPTVSMGENDRKEMFEEEDSMIEETPLALMLDGNGQH
ncbi:hypothetical protein WN943_010999 [Citrus x changshan-huyou]